MTDANVVQLHNPIAHARAVKNRLWNPPNGRQSAEREIISSAEVRRRRDRETKQQNEAKRAEADFRHQKAIDDLMRAQLADHVEAKRIAAKILVEDPVAADTEPLVIKPSDRPPLLRDVVRACADYYGISMLLLLSRRRLQKAVYARQVAYYLCHELTARSMADIGRRLEGRDHTTILFGWNKIARQLKEGDETLAADIAAIKARVSLSEP